MSVYEPIFLPTDMILSNVNCCYYVNLFVKAVQRNSKNNNKIKSFDRVKFWLKIIMLLCMIICPQGSMPHTHKTIKNNAPPPPPPPPTETVKVMQSFGEKSELCTMLPITYEFCKMSQNINKKSLKIDKNFDK